ncbi:MAG: cysteine--tRNA ligase [Candidatus Zambryskibacteria bacterium]|nr:cysteine--tRNA ligase [Candidatus Zambryskibacteria bacterium]
MTLKLYNTLSGQLEEFKPISPSEVRLFVCGPTVYDLDHLGHAKTYTQFDLIARTLRYLGYNVRYIQNITDIDDKIIVRAREKNVEPSILAREYEKYHVEDMEKLGNTSVDKYARATDYISQIISQVERLVAKDMAYKISDGYYFDVSKFSDYGKLSGRNSLKPGDAISRIDENPEKRNPRDFCLWKFKKENEPSWPSSLGEGRPGWHIEDTAITEAEFGPQYDMHGGAMDLIFPHHEAEIAQMESISGRKPFVKYWLHAGFLNIQSEKMSKSLGNFLTIRQVLEQIVSPISIRYLFLLSHYRTPANFSFEALEAAENALGKLSKAVSTWQVDTAGIVDKAYKAKFVEKLENDFNIPQALALVWTLLKDKEVTPENKKTTILDFDKVLGLGL